MRLKDDQVHRLAERVLADLTTGRLIDLKKERGTILAAIKGAIAADLKAEQDLEHDAMKLLEQNLRAMGNAAADIDRHRMLKMIKEKLAKDRKIVL